jgi:hypothetical protein
MDESGGGVLAALKDRMGPFPLYVWLLIMTAIGAVFYLMKKKKGAAATTGTPGTPCTQSDGSAGTWDSTGTVCQASTVSTVNAPASTGPAGVNGSLRNWRAGSGTATSGSGTGTTSATGTGSTVPPAQPPVTTVPPPASTGTTLVTVPNLAGQSAGAAHNALVALGLVPTAPAGQKDNMKVSYTNPGFGARVAPGSKVLIETSGYVT